VFDQKGRAYAANNPWSRKKEEGGRHNRLMAPFIPGGAIVSAAVSSVSTLAGGAGGGAAAASYARIDGGMPNRISMNVTVPKQTQGATFGERVNAGLHAAGSALAQGTGTFRPAFFDIFSTVGPGGFGADLSDVRVAPGDAASQAAQALGAGAFALGDVVLINPGRSLDVMAHEAAHVVQQRASDPLKTKHDTAKNSIGNIR
jgi:hypothetical protein